MDGSALEEAPGATDCGPVVEEEAGPVCGPELVDGETAGPVEPVVFGATLVVALLVPVVSVIGG